MARTDDGKVESAVVGRAAALRARGGEEEELSHADGRPKGRTVVAVPSLSRIGVSAPAATGMA